MHIFYDQVVSMESLVSCLGAGGGDGEGGGGEVEKLAQQLATLEVRMVLVSDFKTLCYELDRGLGDIWFCIMS